MATPQPNPAHNQTQEVSIQDWHSDTWDFHKAVAAGAAATCHCEDELNWTVVAEG